MLVLFGTTAPVSGEIPTCGEFLVMWGAMFIVVVLYIDRKIR